MLSLTNVGFSTGVDDLALTSVHPEALYDTASTAAAASDLSAEIVCPALPGAGWGTLLDGVGQTKLNPSSVTISTELERLVPILIQKSNLAKTEGKVLSKRALFEQSNKYHIGCNGHFASKDASKYRDAMKLIAIATTNGNWDQLIGNGGDGSGDGRATRDLVSDIKKSTMEALKRLQTDYLGLDPNRKFKATQGIRALGDNARAVFNKVFEVKKSLVEREEWLAEKLGECRQSGEQQSLQAAFLNSNKA